jgi:hypothetical protein
MHRTQPILASVCWDGSVSRTTLAVERSIPD